MTSAPSTQIPYSKREVFQHILDSKQLVRIMLDATQEEVIVPLAHKRNRHLLLDVGTNTSPPIEDLVIDDQGVSCTLSFARKPFYCVLTWDAIFLLVGRKDNLGYLWRDDPELEMLRPHAPPDMPPKMSVVAAPASRDVPPAEATDPGQSSSDPDQNSSEEPKKPARPAWLRVVK